MAEENDKKDRSGIQVIARAAEILRALKEARSGLSLGQIATRVDLPRSTVQRIIGALVTERFVIQDPKGGGIRLGPELGAFAEAANFNVVERCRAILTEVTQETGETTDLAVLRNGAMIFLDQVPGLHRPCLLGADAGRRGETVDPAGKDWCPFRQRDSRTARAARRNSSDRLCP